MKERPISFNSAMVRANLAGRKAQTRRVARLTDSGRVARGGRNWHVDDPSATLACPYGEPGDRLWVREAFWSKHDSDSDGYTSIDCGPYLDGGANYCPGWDYCATPRCVSPPTPENEQTVAPWIGEATPGDWWLSPPDSWDGTDDQHARRGIWTFLPWGKRGEHYTKHPSIHMPRWASRTLLEVERVRLERVQAISTADAMAEGIPQTGAEAHRLGLFDMDTTEGYFWDNSTSIENFRELWDSINDKDGRRWACNPWVWVVEYRLI